MSLSIKIGNYQPPLPSIEDEISAIVREIRERTLLVEVALSWEKRFSVMPAIISAISEYDGARLIGMEQEEYEKAMKGRIAVAKGYDFEFNGIRYQVKANRPSGKPGSKVTLVGKANNYDWDKLIWIFYKEDFEIAEAWLWTVGDYKEKLGAKKRLSPDDMRIGERLGVGVS